LHEVFARANVEIGDIFLHMKRLALLFTILALTSCQTTHDAAVTTFRVLDAPHQYVREKLQLDQQNNNGVNTAATTATAQTSAPPNTNPYPQPFQPAPPPQISQRSETVAAPPSPTPHRVAEQRTESESRPAPSPTQRVAARSTSSSSSSHVSATPHPASEKSSIPYAKPVPGKAGYVFSPYDPNGGYVDVTGFAPGSKVKDPYSGKIFLVP
jgi:hypothetical protein